MIPFQALAIARQRQLVHRLRAINGPAVPLVSPANCERVFDTIRAKSSVVPDPLIVHEHYDSWGESQGLWVRHSDHADVSPNAPLGLWMFDSDCRSEG